MVDLFSAADGAVVDMTHRIRLLVYMTTNGCLSVEDFMAQFTPTKQQVDALVGALDLKLASLKRAQKGASSNFVEVYEAEIRMYNGLVDLVKGAVK